MNPALQPGKLVSLRGRDWIVLPSPDPDLLVVKPLGGSDDEIAGIYLPLSIEFDKPVDASFPPPAAEDLGDLNTARMLYEAARLAFRNGAGPFRCLARLSFRPRSYQMVPLIMALRQDTIRLLIADDVGVGKTVEALLIIKELLERRKIERFAVICLPHLCEQWQAEIQAKLDIEAVIIRTSTQARLDRQIQGDISVFEYYPYQIISIDYIKSDARRDVFIEQCPELVIVDEAHTCARPSGVSRTRHQRYNMVSRIARKPEQHVILLTATPHSGKQEEFHSLLGLIKPEFEGLDLPDSSKHQRRELARYFVQRRRGDVEKWMGEDTPFPKPDPIEWGYALSLKYSELFDSILEFARKLIDRKTPHNGQKRFQYWTALGLLRGVMSSPAAGIEMLRTRLDKLPETVGEDAGQEESDMPDNPIHDKLLGQENDNTPTRVMTTVQWSSQQRQELNDFALRLETLANRKDDQKLAAAEAIIEGWLAQGFNPVVFCRYIATARYVHEQLAPALGKRFPGLDVQVITSELPDEVRKQRVEDMGMAKQRVLVATDCLSEGINLHTLFTAVLHYDLPWNPNRLEQREGRVDRFGQTSPVVKACMLYGSDNPIDGVVLDVLLRKVREIKKATGINVPFPEDSQSVIETIAHALLLNPQRRIATREAGKQTQLSFLHNLEFPENARIRANITREVEKAAEREKLSRSIFAQHAIKDHEIETDLREVDKAIGDPRAVEVFVVDALNNLFGVETRRNAKGYTIVTANLPEQLRELLPQPGRDGRLAVSFESPTPEGFHYLGRNHRFVEQLCHLLMANTMARTDRRAARAAVIRTGHVPVKTTILLFRCRNVIEQQCSGLRIVAEEMILRGWQGTPRQRVFLGHEQAMHLLREAHATSNLSPQARAGFLDNELALLESMRDDFNALAEQQASNLVAAHERFSSLMTGKHFQVVYPVLPMDLMGVYVLLPENPQSSAENGGAA